MKLSWCLFPFVFVIALLNIRYSYEQEELVRQTRLGDIAGLYFRNYTAGGVCNQKLYTFLNIPYGKSPVGHLRFAKPQPFGSWHGTLDATTKGPACYQNPSRNFNGTSEDCLQLNIYVPHNLSSTTNKSVMVWIHGGAYISGSGTTVDGSMLALTGNVIVVTINYRLGIFGFLASNDPDAKGNCGLWDQMLALDWIRYNIQDYGGNPRSITIFGESAGGYSVSLLSLIPRNRGSFHRVIAQSGVANSYRALSNFSFISTTKVAEKVGCTRSTNDRFMIQCLRQVAGDDLLRATHSYRQELGLVALSYLPFTPVVDGELFRKEPSLLLQDKSSSEFNFFQSLDMMIGNCDNEGSIVLSYYPLFENKLDINISQGISTDEMCNTFIDSIATTLFHNKSEVKTAVCQKYTVNNGIAEQGRQLLQFYTDAFFIAPGVSMLRDHSDNIQGSTTYQYVFSDELPDMYPNMPQWYKGSAHGTELAYIFYYETLRSTINFPLGAEYLVMIIRKYWTNFAKTG